jgi:3-carboxy-cis,cis-muconate cycloisomerase
MSRPTLDPGFTTAELSAIYSPQRRVEAILEFETALALALADAGIAPREEAEKVAAACRTGIADPDRILISTWDAGTPMITLREEVVAGLDPEAAQWFHHGATTQDAIDTAQMLQAKETLAVLDERLISIAGRLRALTVEHRDQPQVGRTFLQAARPTTFGFRTATWLDAVLTHVVELHAQRDGLPVQLGGPVGTMSEYGDAGPKVMAALANRLGLATPTISWHANRARVLALAHAVERAAATMAKIGSDVALLVSLGEVTVRSGGSSAMPGKMNPIDSIRSVAAASACTGAVAMMTAASPHELDRGVGGWHVEWVAVPLVLQTADAAFEAIDVCLHSLEVNAGTMGTGVADEPVADLPQIDAVLKEFDRTVGPSTEL